MKPSRAQQRAAFAVSMWLLGLFALGQVIAVGFAMRAGAPTPEVKIETIQVPVPVESPYTKMKSARQSKAAEPTLDELIDRLNIDIEETTRKAIKKSRNSSPSNLLSAPAPLDDKQFQLDPDLRKQLNAAIFLRQKGDLGRAMLTLEKLVSEHPNSPPVLYEMALAYEDLRSIPEARLTYLKIFKLGFERAGPFFRKANHKLTYGFGNPAELRGKIKFGIVRAKTTEDAQGTQTILLSIPVTTAPDLELDNSDLQVEVDFYEKTGQSDIGKLQRGKVIRQEWLHQPANWADGEEILVIELQIPPPTAFERELSGIHEFFGYTLKLFYKSEPMDADAAPRSLFITRKKQADEFFPMPDENFLDGGLLPEKNFDPLFFEE